MEKIAAYEKIIGPQASVSPETSVLIKRLESKEEELQVMKLKDTQQEQVKAYMLMLFPVC